MDFKVGQRLRDSGGPVLITGHTGFKGTWLSFLLRELGIPFVGLSLTPKEGSLYNRSSRFGLETEEFLDIRDYAGVTEFLRKHKPATIIHLAAQPLVLESYAKPLETFEVNVLGTANILDAAFKYDSVRAVVIATTDKVYRNNESGVPFVETDALMGKDPYSASKVGTESVIAAWQQISNLSNGPRITGVRAGNVIGGGDWASDRLIPDLAKGFMNNTSVDIRNPESTRPWQHVLDPLMGYVMTLEALLAGRSIDSLNFGPLESSMAVQEVVKIISKVWSTTYNFESSNNTSMEKVEAQALNLDSSRAMSILDWAPVWTQEEAVLETAYWWKDVVLNSKSPAYLCKEQCRKYFALQQRHSNAPK
jgi:CDP-glucose 4,6-dehydratase